MTKAGRGFTDSEVTGGSSSSSSPASHFVDHETYGAMLLSNPQAMADVKAEQEKYIPDEASLKYSNLLEMDCMRRSVTEALRLYPPLILLMRKVMHHGFEVGQHTIPKGDVVGLCAPASNLDPRYWHDATEFKPSRFASGSDEAVTFNSRSVGHGKDDQAFMLSFGGGAHMCSGRRFGYLQVSTIWTILLRDFEMEMTTPVPKPAYNDMVVGPDGPIIMRYKRKPKGVPCPPAAAAAADGGAAEAAAKARAAAAAKAKAAAAPPRRRRRGWRCSRQGGRRRGGGRQGGGRGGGGEDEAAAAKEAEAAPPPRRRRRRRRRRRHEEDRSGGRERHRGLRAKIEELCALNASPRQPQRRLYSVVARAPGRGARKVHRTAHTCAARRSAPDVRSVRVQHGRPSHELRVQRRGFCVPRSCHISKGWSSMLSS